MTRELATQKQGGLPTIQRLAEAERWKRSLALWSEETRNSGLANIRDIPTDLAEALPHIEASLAKRLAPVTDEVMAVAFQRCWDAGVPQPPVETMAEFRRCLSVESGRAITYAFEQVSKTYRWPSPPKLADVMVHVEAFRQDGAEIIGNARKLRVAVDLWTKNKAESEAREEARRIERENAASLLTDEEREIERKKTARIRKMMEDGIPASAIAATISEEFP